MKQPASIKIVTNQSDDKYEFITDGTISPDDQSAIYIEYADGDIPVTIGINSDTVTITRLGSDAYTLIAKEGEAQTVNIAGITFHTYTSKLRIKKSSGRLDVLVEYHLSQRSMSTAKTRYRITCTY